MLKIIYPSLEVRIDERSVPYVMLSADTWIQNPVYLDLYRIRSWFNYIDHYDMKHYQFYIKKLIIRTGCKDA